MKKIIIRQIDSQLVAHIDDITPRLEGIKENVLAIFDVSECFIHC